ncbi:MAG: transposase [Erysipelotrichaceae bacterium]|nr:transposase [Erysipelotrichaceae bacterium]
MVKNRFNYYSLYSSIIENDPILENAVLSKSELDDFYKNSTIETAKANIELLIREFNQSPIKEMNNFSNTLIKWKYEIINSFTVVNNKRITNGIIENRNKSIKLLKHSSNGYLNWKRFRNRIMFSLNKD